MTEELSERFNIQDSQVFDQFILKFHEKFNKVWNDISLSDFIIAHVKSKTETSGVSVKSFQRNFASLIRMDLCDPPASKTSKVKTPKIEKTYVDMESLNFKKSLPELFTQVDKICNSNADAQAFQFMPPFAVSIVQVS